MRSCHFIFVILKIAIYHKNVDDDVICCFRKSLKSLIFLMPLLGITNILHHIWPHPLGGSWVRFAVWSITTHFLYAFQGVFVALAYFFLDRKVHKSLGIKYYKI